MQDALAELKRRKEVGSAMEARSASAPEGKVDGSGTD